MDDDDELTVGPAGLPVELSAQQDVFLEAGVGSQRLGSQRFTAPVDGTYELTWSWPDGELTAKLTDHDRKN